MDENIEDVFDYKQVSSWDTDDVIRWMNGKRPQLADTFVKNLFPAK